MVTHVTDDQERSGKVNIVDDDDRVSLISKHGLALLCIERDPLIRLRDLATLIDVTIRTAFTIVDELAKSGVITRSKAGRRSVYSVDMNYQLYTPGGAMSVADFVRAMHRNDLPTLARSST
jgi:hypothetical protein